MKDFEPTKIEDYCHPSLKSIYQALGFGSPQESRQQIYNSCGPNWGNELDIPDRQMDPLLVPGKGFNVEFFKSPGFQSWQYNQPDPHKLVKPELAHLHDAVFKAGVPVPNTDVEIKMSHSQINYDEGYFSEVDKHMGEGRTPQGRAYEYLMESSGPSDPTAG